MWTSLSMLHGAAWGSGETWHSLGMKARPISRDRLTPGQTWSQCKIWASKCQHFQTMSWSLSYESTRNSSKFVKVFQICASSGAFPLFLWPVKGNKWDKMLLNSDVAPQYEHDMQTQSNFRINPYPEYAFSSAFQRQSPATSHVCKVPDSRLIRHAFWLEIAQGLLLNRPTFKPSGLHTGLAKTWFGKLGLK